MVAFVALVVLSTLIKAVLSTSAEIPFFAPAAEVQRDSVLHDNLAIKFDTDGSQIDAHDGKVYWIEQEQRYVLVGTAYDCGYRWFYPHEFWCGVKIYSSPDLNTWTNHGLAWNARSVQQYGFRPKLAYNEANKKYLIFWNVHNQHYPELGLEIWSSDSVYGPYEFSSRPKTQSTPNDFGIGVGPNGTAYLAYGENTLGLVIIEEFTSDYLQVTGNYARLTDVTRVEAFDITWHSERHEWYLIYGSLCGYCNGTDTTFRRAKSIFGPWSNPKRISDDSCGGQSSFLAALPGKKESRFLYGSDLWNNGHPNEAKAYLYWEPVDIDENGDLSPLKCRNDHSLRDIVTRPQSTRTPYERGPTAEMVDQSSGSHEFRWRCDLPHPDQMMAGQQLQTWTTGKDGTLREVGFALSRQTSDGPIYADIFKYESLEDIVDAARNIVPPELEDSRLDVVKTLTLEVGDVDWGIKNYRAELDIPVKRSEKMGMILRTSGNTSPYCIALHKQKAASNKSNTYWMNNGSADRVHGVRFGETNHNAYPPVGWLIDFSSAMVHLQR